MKVFDLSSAPGLFIPSSSPVSIKYYKSSTFCLISSTTAWRATISSAFCSISSMIAPLESLDSSSGLVFLRSWTGAALLPAVLIGMLSFLTLWADYLRSFLAAWACCRCSRLPAALTCMVSTDLMRVSSNPTLCSILFTVSASAKSPERPELGE